MINILKRRERTPIEIHQSAPKPLSLLEQCLKRYSAYIFRVLCFNKKR